MCGCAYLLGASLSLPLHDRHDGLFEELFVLLSRRSILRLNHNLFLLPQNNNSQGKVLCTSKYPMIQSLKRKGNMSEMCELTMSTSLTGASSEAAARTFGDDTMTCEYSVIRAREVSLVSE